MIPRKNGAGIVESSIDGDIVTMNADGDFSGFSGVARAIWRMIDGVRDVADIKAALAERYDVAPEICDAEVDMFLDDLKRAGLIFLA